MELRRNFFARGSFEGLLDRAVEEMALDKWGEQSNRIFETTMSARILISTIDQYLDAASLSLNRRAAYAVEAAAAWEDKERWGRGGAERYRLFTSRDRAEIHWFLICVNTIRKCLEKLQARTAALKMSSARQVWKRHSEVFTPYQKIRDHIEHGEQRLPGEKLDSEMVRRERTAENVEIIDTRWEFPSPGILKIGLMQCDVSHDGLERIIEVVAHLKDELRSECLDIVVAHTTESGLAFERPAPWEPATAMRDTGSKPGDNVIFLD